MCCGNELHYFLVAKHGRSLSLMLSEPSGVTVTTCTNSWYREPRKGAGLVGEIQKDNINVMCRKFCETVGAGRD